MGIRCLNSVTERAKALGRNYITPEDVQFAIGTNKDDPHRIRIDVLEVIAKQTEFGVEDVSLCAYVAFMGGDHG